MEVELQGQDLKSVIEMENNLLQQKGEVCLFRSKHEFIPYARLYLS